MTHGDAREGSESKIMLLNFKLNTKSIYAAMSFIFGRSSDKAKG
jgi:hypothetical protein